MTSSDTSNIGWFKTGSDAVWQAIKANWPQQTHIFIEGIGGLGKMIALSTFAAESGNILINITAVYIHHKEVALRQCSWVESCTVRLTTGSGTP